jgi:hypothetical protein
MLGRIGGLRGVHCEETSDTRSIVCRKSVTGQRSNQLKCTWLTVVPMATFEPYS